LFQEIIQLNIDANVFLTLIINIYENIKTKFIHFGLVIIAAFNKSFSSSSATENDVFKNYENASAVVHGIYLGRWTGV